MNQLQADGMKLPVCDKFKDEDDNKLTDIGLGVITITYTEFGWLQYKHKQ